MRIAIACDHAGFELKKIVLDAVYETGNDPIDLGTNSYDSVDYAEYAIKVGKVIQSGKAERGILICGSGVGICIAANKIIGVYASVCHDTYSAKQGVQHDNMNVLCLGGRVIGSELTKEIVFSFINAKFLGNNHGEERHARRVEKVREIERHLSRKKVCK